MSGRSLSSVMPPYEATDPLTWNSELPAPVEKLPSEMYKPSIDGVPVTELSIKISPSTKAPKKPWPSFRLILPFIVRFPFSTNSTTFLAPRLISLLIDRFEVTLNHS